MGRRGLLTAAVAGLAAEGGLLSRSRPALAQLPQGDLLSAVQARNQIVVAGPTAVPPFDVTVDGALTGFDRMLMAEVAVALRVRLAYLDLAPDALLPALDARKCDLVAAPLLLTAALAQKYDVTVPIADCSTALLKRLDDIAFGDPSGAAGRRVAVVKDSPALADARRFSATLTQPLAIREYADDAACLAALQAKQVDLVAGRLTALQYQTALHPQSYAVIVPPIGQPAFYVWATRGGAENRSVSQSASTAIGDIQIDGRLGELQTRWFGTATTLPRFVPTPAA